MTTSTEQPVQKIWYVAAQRLCNFSCSYCVSTGEGWEKSSTKSWETDEERERALKIIDWIGTQTTPIGLRIGTLGEPFATTEFLDSLAWLTTRPNIQFVETLTNGSLLERRLPLLAAKADLSKLSLWMSFHPTQTSVERFIRAAVQAQEVFGCFVVVNALFFPGTDVLVEELRGACDLHGLRFNLDVGYDPAGGQGTYDIVQNVVEVSSQAGWEGRAVELGADPRLLATNIRALNAPTGLACGAGSDYVFIGVEGNVYPCSRYYELDIMSMGNVLDEGFRLNPALRRWSDCRAPNGCSNKEDYLNLQISPRPESLETPSLGWVPRPTVRSGTA